jgi:hypothetical protein
VIDLAVDIGQDRLKIDVRRAALELVFNVGAGELVQYALHHREFIEVRIEQGLNNHRLLLLLSYFLLSRMRSAPYAGSAAPNPVDSTGQRKTVIARLPALFSDEIN